MVSSFDGVEMYQQPGSVQRGSHAYFPYHSNPAGHWYSSPAAAYHHQIPEGSAGQQYAAGGNVQDEQPFGYQYHYNELQQQDLVRAPDYRSLVFSCQQPPHGHEESQLPPPRSIKVCNGELASPGSAAGGDVTPPQHMTCRANNVRSPYEWMKKSSYQNQPNNPAPQRSPCRQDNDKMVFEWMKKFSYRDNPDPGKTRTKDKYRVVYSDHQRLELEKEFHYSRYITIRRKAELAANLGLSERQVKIWFQNRRAKERKQVKKREELLQKEKLEAAAHLQLPQAVHAMQAAAAVVGSRPLAPPPPHGVVM